MILFCSLDATPFHTQGLQDFGVCRDPRGHSPEMLRNDWFNGLTPLLCEQLDCSILPHVSRKNTWIWAWHEPLIIALRWQKHAEVSLLCMVHYRQVWDAKWDPDSKQNRTVWKKSVHDIQTSPQHFLHHLWHLSIVSKALEDDWWEGLEPRLLRTGVSIDWCWFVR